MVFDEEKRTKYKIVAKIVDREEGVVEYEDVKMVRLVSKDHKLLIMEDYLPLIGELYGYVEFVFDNKVITKRNVHGFYMHKKNQFTLVIENYIEEETETGAASKEAK